MKNGSKPARGRLNIRRSLECNYLHRIVSEFVREHQAGLQSFRSMRPIDATRKNCQRLYELKLSAPIREHALRQSVKPC